MDGSYNLTMFGDCCIRHFDRGESYCPVCRQQLDSHCSELDQARRFRLGILDLKPAARQLLERGAVGSREIGVATGTTRVLAAHHTARRSLFNLIGVYLPEAQAREALRNIHDYKWIEAEKAGYDIWSRAASESPIRAAALAWAARHLQSFQNWRKPQTA
jgi:hypothetical protein